MIKKIGLKNFGIHKDLVTILNPGINIVLGNNRKGKSTILEAIGFALWGKTKNSKLERIISFGEKKAEVTLDTDNLKSFSRTRSGELSGLEGVDKLYLEQNINLAYQEFLRIFYISSNDSLSLLEPSYFRKFLIGLFELEKYETIYKRLKVDYNVLYEILQRDVRYNTINYTTRSNKITNVVQNYSKQIAGFKLQIQKINAYGNKVSVARGTLREKWNTIHKDQKTLSMSTCPYTNKPCSQIVSEKYKLELKQKIELGIKNLQEAEKKVNAYEEKLNIALAKINAKIDILEYRVSKGKNLLAVIKERLKEDKREDSKKRLSELEQILPVFNPKGFPSYLLQLYIPAIVGTANNLLHSIFPDLTIKIRTLKPDNNTPDLKVIIEKEDNEVDLTDMCGSETVLINLCLRLGLLVIFKQLNKTCLDTLLVDEGFERLDSEVSLQVINLLKNFISLKYINQVVIVTHKFELKELTDVNYINLG